MTPVGAHLVILFVPIIVEMKMFANQLTGITVERVLSLMRCELKKQHGLIWLHIKNFCY